MGLRPWDALKTSDRTMSVCQIFKTARGPRVFVLGGLSPLTRLALVAVVALAMPLGGGTGCKSKTPKIQIPPSPKEAFARLRTAHKTQNPSEIFNLLHTQAQWSVMTIHRAQKKMCALVQAHYPKERQAREIPRCRLAVTHKEQPGFFQALAQQHRLWADWTPMGQAEDIQIQGKRATVKSGRRTYTFCKDVLKGYGHRPDVEGWRFCGLDPALDRLKIKTTRDLTTIQENADAFKGR